jgi:hypothetical protein
MTLWCPRCGRNTSHRVLFHMTPPKTMCYECTHYDTRSIPTVPRVTPLQVPSDEKPRLCHRCYSSAAGGDYLFGTCIEADKSTNPPQHRP